MKICLTYVDAEKPVVDLILTAIRSVKSLRFEQKETPERDGYYHIYMRTKRFNHCKTT